MSAFFRADTGTARASLARRPWAQPLSEFRFTYREIADVLDRTGVEPLAAHPNARRLPKNVGVWVASRATNRLLPGRPPGIQYT